MPSRRDKKHKENNKNHFNTEYTEKTKNNHRLGHWGHNTSSVQLHRETYDTVNPTKKIRRMTAVNSEKIGGWPARENIS